MFQEFIFDLILITIRQKGSISKYIRYCLFLLLGHMPCFSSEFLNREMSAEKQKNHLLCRWWEKLKLQVKELQYHKNMGSSATF